MVTGNGQIDFATLKWDGAGLVTVVAQERHTGEIRMVAHANRAALQATLEQGRAHFFSRSRQRLWMKGEESGHTLAVREVWVDCDGDAVIYMVEPSGPSCHTGRPTCFYRRLRVASDGMGKGAAESEPRGPAPSTTADAYATPTLEVLWHTLVLRRDDSAAHSYTRSLLDGGATRIGDKMREEADELATALMEESDARVVAEAADVAYHVMVGLLSRGVSMRDVLVELDRRHGVSGHVEKAGRPAG